MEEESITSLFSSRADKEKLKSVPISHSQLCKRNKNAPVPSIVIHLHKIDEIHINDCEPDDFRVFLTFCYNQNIDVVGNLSVDRLIKLNEISDKFIVKNLTLIILKLLKKKFTTI